MNYSFLFYHLDFCCLAIIWIWYSFRWSNFKIHRCCASHQYSNQNVSFKCFSCIYCWDKLELCQPITERSKNQDQKNLVGEIRSSSSHVFTIPESTIFFHDFFVFQSTKGQIKSEWIYEIVNYLTQNSNWKIWRIYAQASKKRLVKKVKALSYLEK